MPERSGHVAQGPSRRILLAEDSRLNQRVATAMLENLGCRVDVVGDGAEAVKAAALEPYHAIFMDCQIPVLDGYQATREIRRNEGAARHTPIVGVTASALSSARERSLAAGMDDHLTKPLTRESLATALSRWTAGGLTPVAAIEADEHRSTAAPATTLAGGAARVLDAEVIARLKRLGEDAGQDLLGELTTIFLADADIRMAELRTAIAEEDATTVARLAHTLSGASASIGATDLANLFLDLERRAMAGDLTGDRSAQLGHPDVGVGQEDSCGLGPAHPALRPLRVVSGVR